MRFISTNIHGLLDYLLGALLVALPWLMGYAAIGGPETWVPVTVGVGIIAYSLMTDYEWGVRKSIGLRAHLMLDVLAGATLLLTIPYYGHFDGTIWPFHIGAGLVLIAGGLLTDQKPRSERPRFERPQSTNPAEYA